MKLILNWVARAPMQLKLKSFHTVIENVIVIKDYL